MEKSNAEPAYYLRVVDLGDERQIWDQDALRGNLSLASQTVTLETSRGFFDGKCHQT